MENQRSASLSLKQGLGILTAMIGLMLIFSLPFALLAAIITNLEKNHSRDFGPMLIGSLVGCLIVLAMAVGSLIISIRLLKDPRGMAIPFLDKRFNGKKSN